MVVLLFSNALVYASGNGNGRVRSSTACIKSEVTGTLCACVTLTVPDWFHRGGRRLTLGATHILMHISILIGYFVGQWRTVGGSKKDPGPLDCAVGVMEVYFTL